MKKIISLAIALAMFSFTLAAQTPKYIFFFIGDGMGVNEVFGTQYYNRVNGLPDVNFASFPVKGMLTSYSASSLVTDSSAAGTALSSGVKINNGWIGMDPEGNVTVPITEIAKRNGFGTAVVTSVGVNHATPGAFYGHDKSRNSYSALSQQLIETNTIDFAAGATFLTHFGEALKAKDWIAKAKEAGINVFVGQDEYKAVKGERVIYLAKGLPDSVPYAIDRKPGDTQLSDFTGAAIDYLYANFAKKGFVMMVEGGKIDYACHATDAATTVHEVNDMAKSVALALEFYAKHPNETLILVTADHETGGLDLGHGAYELHPENLQYQACSKDVLNFKLMKLAMDNAGEPSWAQVKALLKENLGLWDKVAVTKEWEKKLTTLYKEAFLDRDAEDERNLYSSNSKLTAAAIQCVDELAHFTYPFGSHSASPVPLFVKGARAEAFQAAADNTDLCGIIKKVAKMK